MHMAPVGVLTTALGRLPAPPANWMTCCGLLLPPLSTSSRSICSFCLLEILHRNHRSNEDISSAGQFKLAWCSALPCLMNSSFTKYLLFFSCLSIYECCYCVSHQVCVILLHSPKRGRNVILPSPLGFLLPSSIRNINSWSCRCASPYCLMSLR